MKSNVNKVESHLAVRTRGLAKRFKDLRAVDGIDLEVKSGEIYGVLGPNGAGKTTMLRMLATLLPIDEGHAEIFGVDVRTQPHVVRQLIGMTGQYASVDGLMQSDIESGPVARIFWFKTRNVNLPATWAFSTFRLPRYAVLTRI
jgi:ABC-type Na+ transport system ATPase subunit NatA